MEQHINARSYRTSKEKFYFMGSVLISALFYGWIVWSVFKGNYGELFWLAILIAITCFYIFFHFLAMAAIRINSVKAGPNQFPELWEAMRVLSERVGLKTPPDLHIMQAGGELNAFATRLVSRKMLVIFSDLASALTEGNDREQLKAVVAHELGHHVLNHTHFYNWFLVPFIPFLNSALSRAREYSADQVMKALVPDQNTCERALVKLVSGKTMGNLVNIESYIEQTKTEKGFFVWLSEALASHPHLPKRILEIQKN